jgi:hypothetical protein
MPRVYLETPMSQKPTYKGWYSLTKGEDGFPHRCFYDGDKWNDDLVTRLYSHWLKPIIINDNMYETLSKEPNLLQSS